MVHDKKLICVCGETSLANAKQLLITMMQVYEYFISHHMAGAFESLFGSVTCLPCCFALYRLPREPQVQQTLLVVTGSPVRRTGPSSVPPPLVTITHTVTIDVLNFNNNLNLLGVARFPESGTRGGGPSTDTIIRSPTLSLSLSPKTSLALAVISKFPRRFALSWVHVWALLDLPILRTQTHAGLPWVSESVSLRP
jgi:hypothetical protein